MIDARVSPFSTRRTSRLTPWLAAMAPSVSPETTVYGAPATADPAPAGAGTAGVGGCACAEEEAGSDRGSGSRLRNRDGVGLEGIRQPLQGNGGRRGGAMARGSGLT